MTPEQLSMRQAARELGVSLLRVRELIKKGRLHAEKVSDPSGDHWEISRSSVEGFRSERANEDADGRGSAGREAHPPVAGRPHLAVLLPELEQQVDRVKALVQEISRAQSYLEGLRETQRQLEAEIEAVRRGMQGPEPAPSGDARAPEATEPKADVPEAPEAMEPEAVEPEAMEPEPEAKESRAGKKKPAEKTAEKTAEKKPEKKPAKKPAKKPTKDAKKTTAKKTTAKKTSRRKTDEE